jgi:hypothetical protein
VFLSPSLKNDFYLSVLAKRRPLAPADSVVQLPATSCTILFGLATVLNAPVFDLLFALRGLSMRDSATSAMRG